MVALIVLVAKCVLSVAALSSSSVASLSFKFSTFNQGEIQNDIRIEGDASFSVNWIDISANKFTGIRDSTGRASYAKPVPLWNNATGEVASFTTRFSFFIDLLDLGNKGTGMAFFLAAYPSVLPDRSWAYNLGLTNQTPGTVASGDTRFVAVEFDTFKDTAVSDPNTTYDHLGIDVNSVISVKTLTLESFSLQGLMTAEIEYDNVSSNLSLKLWNGNMSYVEGPDYSLSATVDLRSTLPEQVAIGFSATTSTSGELHHLLSWEFKSSLEADDAPASPSSARLRRRRIIGGSTAGAALFVLGLGVNSAILLIRRRQRSNDKKHKIDEEDIIISSNEDGGWPIKGITEMVTGPRRFSYRELLDATRNFAPEEKLGQGGFGAVYRGYLPDRGGLALAIKRFSKESSAQGMAEYKSEIKVISRLRHRNLVQLVGWCHGRGELLLVYELMPNRSLDIHLYSKDTLLTWPMRVKIVLGLGSALLYLHEEWEQCVVHRDIKPSNVMLDESFGAKLGDFGLARLIDHAVGAQTVTAISGTPGYMDPHCLITGRASAESDVYSFGVLLLEVACGRRPVVAALPEGQSCGGVSRLVEWAWDLYGRGLLVHAADKRLILSDDDGGYDAMEVERVMVVGLWCAHPDPCARPSIRAALAVLQSREAVYQALPVLPTKMPVPTYPAALALPDGRLCSSRASSSTEMLQTSGQTVYRTASDGPNPNSF